MASSQESGDSPGKGHPSDMKAWLLAGEAQAGGQQRDDGAAHIVGNAASRTSQASGGSRRPAKRVSSGNTTLMDVLLMRPQVARWSTRDIVPPQTHRLPESLMWSIVLLTAVGMASINFVSLLVIEYSLQWKFHLMQKCIDHAGVLVGMAVLAVVSVCYSICGVSIILLFAPNCGGSGLPECKCYLNGSPVLPSFFTVKNLFARILTSILANAAGFPVGREGPTVTIGSNLAYLVSHRFTMPFVKAWVDLSPNVSTVIVDEERFAHATRINCAVGGACAMAMLFNTPIGGLLYMFEEISAASWPVELTFRAFVATTMCTLASYTLLGMVNKEIRDFVIFAWLPQNKEWSAGEIPVFMLMAAFLGAVTSYHTRMMLEVARVRKIWQDKFRFKRLGIAGETILYCAICSLLSGFVSLIGTCRDVGQSGLQYVRFNCPEGQYNPIASLLVNTSHSSVKLLFSGANEGELLYKSSAVAFVTYFALNVCLAGLPVPGGAFTATMLLGGLFGRCVGAILRTLGFDAAVSGVYAVVGASAMLCGFKQMAAAVVLIVVQSVNDFNMTPIVMLSVSVALLVNRSINERGHDEEQIVRKRLPYLEPEVPHILDSLVAQDLLEKIPAEAILSPRTHVVRVEMALEVTEQKGTLDFPVLDGNICVGIITRAHLIACLKAESAPRTLSDAFLPTGSQSRFDLKESTKVRRSDALIIARVNSGMSMSPASDEILPLDKIMDPTPFTIGEDMPAPRFYSLFAKAGETAAVVTSSNGEFRGMITRKGLVDAAR